MDVRFISWAGYELKAPITVTSGTTSSGIGSGTIEIEPGWQLLAIPIEHGYWDNITHAHIHDDITTAKFKNYILDQIVDLYGAGNVDVANTYTGDQQAFFSYVVGSTPEGSPHNFQLIYADGSNQEISGFWLHSTASGTMNISWGE